MVRCSGSWPAVDRSAWMTLTAPTEGAFQPLAHLGGQPRAYPPQVGRLHREVER